MRRQPVTFSPAEGGRSLRRSEITNRCLHYVAELELRVNEVIADIEIAVMLQREAVTTGFGEDADCRRQAVPKTNLSLKELNEDPAQVLAIPGIKNVAEELAVSTWGNTPVGHHIPGTSINLRHGGERAACVVPLDNGNELQVRCAKRTQETIDILPLADIRAMHCAKNVVFNAGAAKGFEPLPHRVESRSPGSVAAIAVVDLPRPVDADAEQKVLARKEGRPVVVEQGSVGLKRIFDLHSVGLVFPLQIHNMLEECKPEHSRLAALPNEEHCALASPDACIDQVPHVTLQHGLGHAELLFVRVEFVLLQIVAISAIQVAAWAHRLCHYGKRGRRVHTVLSLK
ncbi:hypothetical protein GALL_429550 [mine drainage metagenome]|uniref:Uncharacterized protein n=1 Tax=mine drainage metagenome TaxID=410659 RepID=A0A1J5Q659_9ZZZZ